MTTSMITDGMYVVAEYVGANSTYYYRGMNLMGYVTGDDVGYYRFNAHGDVIAVTDIVGKVITEYNYNPFGKLEDDENEWLKILFGIYVEDNNPFRYCAEYYDSETEFIYLRARYYSPGLQRFISEDPIRDGFNWYAYCGNNAIMFVDPLGLAQMESIMQKVLEDTKLSEEDEALYQKALEQDGEEAAKEFRQGIVTSKMEFNNSGENEYAKKIRAHKKALAWRSKYDENAEANDHFDYTFGGAYEKTSMAVISEDYSVDSDPLGINIYETWSTEVYFDRIDGEAVQYYKSLNEKRTAADQEISILINLFLFALGLTGLKETIASALIGLFFNECSVSSLFTGNGEFFCTEGSTLQISYQQTSTYDYSTSSYSVTRIMYYNIVDIEGNTKKFGQKIVNMPLF